MKQFNKRAKMIMLVMFMSLVVPTVVFCQPPPDTNDVDTPIDGGISLLVAAGAIVGTKKVRDARKRVA
jgi:hypothetical protein